MKKLLSIGMLTVCVLAISERQAQAWVNSRFSIGLNWHHQSANTSYLWGLWRNGQIPGPEAFGPGAGMPPGMGAPGMGAPGMGAPGAGQFPFLGAGLQTGAPQQGGFPQGAFQTGMQPGYPQMIPQGYPQAQPQGQYTETAPPALLNNTQQQPYYQPNMAYNGSNPYQAVSYQPNSYNYGYGYSQPNYSYFPAYNYEAPYYWYGAR